MKNILLLIASSAIVTTSIAQCSGLYFSEYIEGSGINKAIEIFNPTAQAIDLTGYSVELYSNGATSANSTLVLSGTLNSGEVYVIVNTSSQLHADITAQKDTSHAVCAFNGDDAIALFNGTTQIDGIGVIGVRPSGSWPVGTGATKDYTLVRMATINTGNTTWVGSGDTEWDVYAQDDFTFLGSHTANGCGTSTPALTGEITLSDDTICIGTVINYNATISGGTAPYSVTVNFGDGSSSSTLSGTHTYSTAATYTLVYSVTDDATPSETYDSTITVVVDACSFINEEQENVISIYPNPSKDGIVNLSNLLDKSTVTVYNVIGEAVYSAVINNNEQLNLTSLNKGSYFLTIDSNSNRVTKKLIIQ